MERLNSMVELKEMINCYEHGFFSKKKHTGKKCKLASPQKKQRLDSPAPTAPPHTPTAPPAPFVVISPPDNMQLPLLPQSPSNRVENGISYRTYQSAQQAMGVLTDLSCVGINVNNLQSIVITKHWHTLNNDVHDAIVRKYPKKDRCKVGRIKVRKDGRADGNLVVTKHPPIEANETEQRSFQFTAQLENIPSFLSSSHPCLVCSAIGESLGGNYDKQSCKWFFENREIAIHHILLCAICTVADKDFYVDKLVKRAMKDSGGEETNTQQVVGYWAEGSGKVVGYYLVLTPRQDDDAPMGTMFNLHIIFPSRKTSGTITTTPYCCVRLL
jgi:hypothetical protein